VEDPRRVRKAGRGIRTLGDGRDQEDRGPAEAPAPRDPAPPGRARLRSGGAPPGGRPGGRGRVRTFESYGTSLPGLDLSELNGWLIVIEGPDGVGRTTLLDNLR